MKKHSTLLSIKCALITLFFSASFYTTAQSNIAPLATVSGTGTGAAGCQTGPCSTFNDLNFGTCGTQQTWISTATPPSTIPGDDWIQFDFPSPRAFNEIIIHHANNAADHARFLSGALIQNWNGTSWVNHSSFTGLTPACITSIPIPKMVTSRFRITSFELIGPGQRSNPNFREIEIIEAPTGQNDAAAMSLDAPLTFCAGNHDVFVTIGNLGINQIDSLEVHWELNGIPQPTYFHNQLLDTINGNFPYTAQVNIGTGSFNVGMNDLKIYTSMPNGAVDTLNLNDTIKTTVQTALPPTGVTISNNTLTSVDVNVSGASGTIDYEYGILGFTLGTGTTGNSASSSFTLSGLTQSTTYDIYVRSNCGSGDVSSYIGPFIFYTANGLPFIEDFQTFPISTAAVNFKNWTNSNGTVTPRWQTGSSTSSASTGPTIDHTIGTGGIFTYFETSGGTLGSSNDLLSPIIYIDSSYNTIEFEFWYHKYGATMGDLEVYIDTNNVSNLITTIPGQTHFAGNDPWVSYSAFLSGYEGQDIQLRFRGIRGSSFTGDMAVDDISLDPVAAIDASISDLIDPLKSFSKCYTSTENVTVELSNMGQNPLDFTTDSAVITVDVTGAVTQTLNFTVNDNSINSGNPLPTVSSIQVPMGTLDMSTLGTYYFTSTVNVNNDGVALNNTHLDTIVVMAPMGGTITGTELICMGDSVDLTSDGYFGSLQWQSSTGGAFTDIPGATSDEIVILPNTTTSYRIIACGTNYSDTLTVTPVAAPTTMGDTAIVNCGSFGTAILGASSPVPNLIFDWYDDPFGGLPIHSGDTMHYGVQTGLTPNMSADTFYVSTKLGGGGTDTLTIVPFLGGNSCGGGNMFNIVPSTNLTVEGFSINSLTNGPETVEVYRKNGTYDGSQLIPTNWTLVEMVNITANGSTNPSYVPLTNTFSINAGDTMGIYVYFNASYTNVTTGTVYSNPDMQVIIGDGLCGNFTGVNTGRAFNGQVMYTSGCETNRTMVVGAVDCVVGMDEQSNISNVNIHPNPSNGVFILSGNNVEEEIEVSIYNTNGKKVYQLKSKLNNDFRKQVDMSELAKGIYFVKVQGRKSFQMKKIVIQ